MPETTQPQGAAEPHAVLVDRATRAAQGNKAFAERDPHRLAYHLAPPSGWTNDPNGLIQFQGLYHAFYQHCPYGPDEAPKHWGHAASEDLVHWRHLPVALAPSEPYELGDNSGGCWSGSAVDDGGTLTLIYTAASRARHPKQVQCLATSADGAVFTKHEGNPVLAEPPPGATEEFRDPKVWRQQGVWYMVVGSSAGGRGQVALYHSGDLRRWQFAGIIAASDGTQGSMWECPDLFALGGRHVLMFSPVGAGRSRMVCMVGHMDFASHRFVTDHRADADHGPDFYAGQTFLDARGRRILIGWMGRPGAPMPTNAYGWASALTLPRVVTLLPDGSLSYAPVPELEALRAEHHHHFRELVAAPGEFLGLDGPGGDALEVAAEFAVEPGAEFGLSLRRSANGSQETLLTYDAAAGRLRLDRRRSGAGEADVHEAPVPVPRDGTLRLRVFLDRSSVEVFAHEGRVAMTARIYPPADSRHLGLTCRKGRCVVKAMDVWPLRSIW